ncbi:MAG: amino acid permease [Gammaproteobacteria bacterium]|nr:amino acid permease [Gammaproteobacteria bacterium]
MSGPALPRRLGVFTAAAIVMGITIGSGIFRVPSSIASVVDSVGGMALLWVVAGLITLCFALSLSELATMFPRAGGNFVFVHESFGPAAAFLYGWTFMWINPAGWAAIAVTGAEYLGHFVPMTPLGQRAVAIAVILAIVIANYRSVPLAAMVQNAATSAKALALLALAVLVFALWRGDSGALAQPISFDIGSVGGFGVALVTVLWAYEGVASFCALCGEVRDPARALPRALILGVLAVIALYLIVNAAYAYVLSIDEMQASRLVAADAMMRVTGNIGAGLVAALVVLSTFGAVAALAMADPRVFYAMGREGLFFEYTSRVHPHFKTPHNAVVTAGLIACMWVSIRNFEQLAAVFVLGVWPFYALEVIGMMKLRRTRPDLPRPYRTLGYPVVPLVFIGAALLLLVNSLILQPRNAFISLGITLLGLPVYFLWRRSGRAAVAPS